jgi:hypothetical protein
MSNLDTLSAEQRRPGVFGSRRRLLVGAMIVVVLAAGVAVARDRPRHKVLPLAPGAPLSLGAGFDSGMNFTGSKLSFNFSILNFERTSIQLDAAQVISPGLRLTMESVHAGTQTSSLPITIPHNVPFTVTIDFDVTDCATARSNPIAAVQFIGHEPGRTNSSTEVTLPEAKAAWQTSITCG